MQLFILMLGVGIDQLVSHPPLKLGTWVRLDSGHPMHRSEGKILSAVKVILHQLA